MSGVTKPKADIEAVESKIPKLRGALVCGLHKFESRYFTFRRPDRKHKERRFSDVISGALSVFKDE